MNTLKHHKFENIPTSSGAALPTDTSTIPYLESHFNESEIILKNFNQYLLAATVFEEQGNALIKSLKLYSSTLRNENDRDIVFAKKGTEGLTSLLEKLHSVFSLFIHELKEKEVNLMKEDLADLLVYPKETKKLMEKHQAQLEETRKAYRDTVASKKTTPAKIREAQEAQESQKAKCTTAEQDYADQVRNANFALCCQGPRAFATAYTCVEKMGQELFQYATNARGAYNEIVGQVESDWSARIVVSHVTSGCFGKLIEAEKESMSQLSMVIDIYTRMTAEADALRLKPGDTTAIFGPIFEIFTIHSELLADLEKATESQAKGGESLILLAKILSERIVPFERNYVPFVRGHCEYSTLIGGLRNSKPFQMIMQAAEQQIGGQSTSSAVATSGSQQGQTQLDLSQLLTQVGKHVHSLKYTLQSIVAAIPNDTPDNKSGLAALDNTIKGLSRTTDKLDDIFIEMEHIKQLSGIKEQLPDLYKDIDELPTRVFIYDSDAAITGGGGQKQLIPNIVFAQPSQEKSSRKHGRSKYVPPHRLFLFNDYLIIAERNAVPESTDLSITDFAPSLGLNPSGVNKTTFRSLLKLSITKFEATPDPGSRDSIRITQGDSYLTISLFSEARVPVWIRFLNNAQKEWGQTQFYGMSLQKIMARPSEKGRLIPHLLEEFMALVEQDGWIDSEGVYRLSTGKLIIGKVRGLIDSGKPFEVKDVFLASNLLKLWFRELPDPLFSYKLHDEWGAAETVADVQNVLRKMPIENRNLIQAISLHLKHITEHSEKNMMNVNNLVIVFQPSLLRPLDQRELFNNKKMTGSPINILIESYDEVFTGDLAPKITKFTSTILMAKPNEPKEEEEEEEGEEENEGRAAEENTEQEQSQKNEFTNATSLRLPKTRSESKFLSGHRSVLAPTGSPVKDLENAATQEADQNVSIKVPEKKESKSKKSSSKRKSMRPKKTSEITEEINAEDESSSPSHHRHKHHSSAGSDDNGAEEEPANTEEGDNEEATKKCTKTSRRKSVHRKSNEMKPDEANLDGEPEGEKANETETPVPPRVPRRKTLIRKPGVVPPTLEPVLEPEPEEPAAEQEPEPAPEPEEAPIPARAPRKKVLPKTPTEGDGEAPVPPRAPRRKTLIRKPGAAPPTLEPVPEPEPEEPAPEPEPEPEEPAKEQEPEPAPEPEEAPIPARAPRKKVLPKTPTEGDGEAPVPPRAPRRKTLLRKPGAAPPTLEHEEPAPEPEPEPEEPVVEQEPEPAPEPEEAPVPARASRKKVLPKTPTEDEVDGEALVPPRVPRRKTLLRKPGAAPPSLEHEEPVPEPEPEPEEPEEPAMEQEPEHAPEPEEAPIPARAPRKKVLPKTPTEAEGNEEAPVPPRAPRKKVLPKKPDELEPDHAPEEPEVEPEPIVEQETESAPEPEEPAIEQEPEPEEAPIPARAPRKKVLPKTPTEVEGNEEAPVPPRVPRKKMLPKKPTETEPEEPAEEQEPEEEHKKMLPKRPEGALPAPRGKRVAHSRLGVAPPRPPPKLGMANDDDDDSDEEAPQPPPKPRAKGQVGKPRARCPVPPPPEDDE